MSKDKSPIDLNSYNCSLACALCSNSNEHDAGTELYTAEKILKDLNEMLGDSMFEAEYDDFISELNAIGKKGQIVVANRLFNYELGDDHNFATLSEVLGLNDATTLKRIEEGRARGLGLMTAIESVDFSTATPDLQSALRRFLWLGHWVLDRLDPGSIRDAERAGNLYTRADGTVVGTVEKKYTFDVASMTSTIFKGVPQTQYTLVRTADLLAANLEGVDADDTENTPLLIERGNFNDSFPDMMADLRSEE
jgi:hypothetical protein